MTLTDFLALVLGTWGLAWLLVYGVGPVAVLARLRKLVGVDYTADGQRYGHTWVGDLFNCPICLSVWIAPVLLLMIILGLWWIAWILAAVGVAEIASNVGG